jgi:hypothetical protein
MRQDELEALQLIEKAVVAIQARQHPGRPIYYALSRLRDEVRKAQREARIGAIATDQVGA